MAREFNPGKLSQHGFSFQKMSFFYLMMKKMSKYNKYVYEGNDDFDFYHTEDNSSLFVQAKTGNLSADDKKAILIAWIKMELIADKYILFAENDTTFDPKIYIDDVVDIIKSSSSKNRLSNARQAYDKYCDKSEFDETRLRKDLSKIVNNCEKMVMTSSNMFSDLRNVFIELSKNDVLVDSIIENRIYYVLKKVLLKIFDALSASSNNDIFFDFNEVVDFICLARESFPFDRFNEDYTSLKQNVNKNMIIDSSKREVKQMQNIGLPDELIVEKLINEIFYKKFRDFYTDIKLINEIKDVEDNAYQNYFMTKTKMKLSGEKKSIGLFFDVMAQNIDHKLIRELNNSKIASQGCYVYLSSDSSDENYKIDWEF